MINIRKLITVILILSIALSLTACQPANSEPEYIEVSVETPALKIAEEFSTVISVKKENVIKYNEFKISDITLGGAFSGLEITAVENAADSVIVSIKGNLSVEHVYYEDELNDHLLGYIGLNYKNNTYYAGIDLIGPEFSVNQEAIEIDGQGQYDFEITLENSEFVKEITVSDIELRGSFENMTVDSLVNDNNQTLSLKLSGEVASNSSGIIHFFDGFDQSGVSSDVLVKILPEAILYTSNILFLEHDFEEDVVLRLKYHDFAEDIGVSNIVLGAGLEKAVVSNLVYLEPDMIKLTLTGLLDKDANKGTITLLDNATSYGKTISAAISISENRLFFEPNVLAAAVADEINAYSLIITSLADYPSSVVASDIAFDGVFEGMTISSVSLMDSETLKLEFSGNCPVGVGTIRIGDRGLYDVDIYADHHEVANAVLKNTTLSNNGLTQLGSTSLSNSSAPVLTQMVDASVPQASFDYTKILGSAAEGLASLAGGAAASYILDATGIYKSTDKMLAQINQGIKDLQKSLDASTEKITKGVDECNIKVQTAVIKDYISSYETYKTRFLSINDSTGSNYLDELANKMEVMDFMKVLNHINRILTDETDGTRNLINTYNDYLAKVYPFQHQIDDPLKQIVQYYALIQADMLYYYGVYSNYKYSQTGDASYLNDFQTATDTVTANIANQMSIAPNNPLLKIVISERTFYFPIVNSDGRYRALWDPVSSANWFERDTHIDEPSLGQILQYGHYWHYTFTIDLVNRGFRVPTTDDIDKIKTDFFKNTTLNTGTFLLNNGIVLSGGYDKIYLETCDLFVAEYYYFLDGNNMSYDYHKMGSASKLPTIWLVIYLAR